VGAAPTGFAAEGDDDLSVFGLLALKWGLRFSAMQHEWAEGEIRRGSGTDTPLTAR
jgi:PadR family transcriptional regulator, regulatory protein AphA